MTRVTVSDPIPALARLLPVPALLLAPLLVLALMAPAAQAQRGGGCYYCGGGEPEEEEVEPTGITHVIYMVGTGFFPDRVHAGKGDELMFVNLTNYLQRVEYDAYDEDDSWSSGWMDYKQTYPILLEDGGDINFEGTFYYDSYWGGSHSGTYSGRVVSGEPDSEADPSDYPYLATSLAEVFNVYEAVNRIHATRTHVYTVDQDGRVMNNPGTN